MSIFDFFLFLFFIYVLSYSNFGIVYDVVGISIPSGDSRNFSQGVPRWACSVTIFFFFRFSVTIFFFLDFSSENFFFSFFFFLESNVMNTVLDPISICLMERNILVPFYFDIGCGGTRLVRAGGAGFGAPREG